MEEKTCGQLKSLTDIYKINTFHKIYNIMEGVNAKIYNQTIEELPKEKQEEVKKLIEDISIEIIKKFKAIGVCPCVVCLPLALGGIINLEKTKNSMAQLK